MILHFVPRKVHQILLLITYVHYFFLSLHSSLPKEMILTTLQVRRSAIKIDTPIDVRMLPLLLSLYFITGKETKATARSRFSKLIKK